MARMSLKKAFDAFMDAKLTKSLDNIKNTFYDGDVLKAGATIEEYNKSVNRIKQTHANIYKNSDDLVNNQIDFINKTLNGSKGKKVFIGDKAYGMSGSIKLGELYPTLTPIGDNIHEGVLNYDMENWIEGTRKTGTKSQRIKSFKKNINTFINDSDIEIEMDGNALDDIKASVHRAREAAKNGSPSKIINDRNTLDEVIGKKSFSAPDLSRTNNRGSLRPDVVMNGNSLEVDSIYNHSVPKSVNKGWGHTSSPGNPYDDMMNVIKNDSRYVDRQQANVERQRERARQDLERQEQKQREKEQARQERDRQEKEWQEQRRQQQQQEQAQTQSETQTQPEVQTQPETQTRQDRTNVNRNGKPDQGPIPNTTSGPYVNNTRIDLDPETSVSTMDISDPLNIHQRIVDGNGNTRDITWRRKGKWSEQKELVSDISWNENGVFDNIAQTYTGKDVSPIEWKYAADWSDDYIIGRAGDDEQLLNSMMNARERKIEARRKYEEKHNRQQQSSNTADNTAQQQVDGPKTFDPNDPTTWTDKDIVNMADGDPEVYEELLNQRNEATGGSTQNVEAANETVNPPDAEPDMSSPLNWTDEYMDEMSEGDPTYYEQLSKQRDAAIKADKYKNIDPSNPSSWTDDYIKDTALNEDEFNWMNEKMRQAKNLDIVDNINQQRHASSRAINREQKRQQVKDNRQKGNQQKKKTKKQKEKGKKNKQFNDRHKAMGNDPEEQKRINKEYNEARHREKEQEIQQKEIEEQERQRRQAEAEQRQRIDSGDPSQWTDEDIRKMADGDPDVYEDLINQRDKAREVDISQRTSDYNKEIGDTDAPKVGDADIEKLEVEGLQGTDMDASMRRGTLGTVDKIMTGVNILGAIGDYKSYRRQGDNVISAGVKTAAKFAIDEALGLWTIPIAIVKNVPGAIIKGADMLYKENRKMNSAAGQQIFGNAQFLDTQQLATMRQSGMEMAKMSQYNLQQTLMGQEATYLHR